jgi:hypothetical protein
MKQIGISMKEETSAAAGPACIDADPAQLAYAAVLKVLTAAGSVMLVAGFALYAGGLLPGGISAQTTASLWHLRARDFVSATGGYASAWTWLNMLDRGEAFSFASLVYLAGVSMAAFAVACVVFLRRRNRLYALLCLLQIVVLVLAAAGIGMEH